MPNLKEFLVSVALLLAAGILAALAFIHSGIFNVAADKPPSALEHWILATTRKHSVGARSDDIKVPEDIGSPARIRSGARAYDLHCAECHLHPGMEPNALYRGLHPPPPKLDGWSEHPAYTFWIIKHGVRSTGMPAWGRTLDAAAIWDIVAFQRQLPDLSAQEYKVMVGESRETPPRNR